LPLLLLTNLQTDFRKLFKPSRLLFFYPRNDFHHCLLYVKRRRVKQGKEEEREQTGEEKDLDHKTED
jgi:hypothetical protein